MPASKPSAQSNIIPASASGIARAVDLLRRGQAVALPTETVYGLAADAASTDAVASIYRIKGRPDFNPLIVHVPDVQGAAQLAHLDDRAAMLAEKFWPGALTMVLPLRKDAPAAPAVTAGLATIAIRCPAHPVMRSVLVESGLFLAAPSANRSGAISPTEASHVAASLGERVPLVLDGGPCSAGLESTIVAMREHGWQVLRPGPVSEAEIAAILGEPPVGLTGTAIEAPGQLASHYAPSQPLRLNVLDPRSDEYMIGFGAVGGDVSLSEGGDLSEAAARLYAALHRGDAAGRGGIAVAPIPDSGMGVAINDRLRRAAADKQNG